MKHIKNNIPNILTISRIILCAIAPIYLVIGRPYIAIILYLIATITDFFDGYFARKFNAFSKLGQLLDPISDKVLGMGIMISSIIMGNYFLISIVILEICIAIPSMISYFKHLKPYTERVGKVKTAILFPTIILGLFINYNEYFLIPFLILYIITIRLEQQSLFAYINQYKISSKLKKENKKLEDPTEISIKYAKKYNKKEPIFNKIGSLFKELISYLFIDIKLIS